MGLDFLEHLKYRKCEFEDLDLTEEKVVFGRLKALEELAVYIEQMRLSLTRLLVVNDQSGETDEEVRNDWKERESKPKERSPTPVPLETIMEDKTIEINVE